MVNKPKHDELAFFRMSSKEAEALIQRMVYVVSGDMGRIATGDARNTWSPEFSCYEVFNAIHKPDSFKSLARCLSRLAGINTWSLPLKYKGAEGLDSVSLIKEFMLDPFVSKRLERLGKYINTMDPVNWLDNWSGGLPVFFCSRPLPTISKKAFGQILTESSPHVHLCDRFLTRRDSIFIEFELFDAERLRAILSILSKKFSYPYGMFVRACPEVPRHGIIDSINIEHFHETPVSATAKTILNLRDQMLEQGENTGVLIVPFLRCSYSGVSSKNMTVYGLGNAGVTAGGSRTLTVNHGYEQTSYISEMIENKLSKNLQVETEFVYAGDQRPYLTQLRNSTNEGLRVAEVPNSYKGFTRRNDLRLTQYSIYHVKGTELEQLEKIPEGDNVLIVHHDGALLSHASAWSRQKGWAFIVVEDGWTIKQPQKYLCEAAPGCVIFADHPIEKKSSVSASTFQKIFFKTFDHSMIQPPNSIDDLRQLSHLIYSFHQFSTETTVTKQIAMLCAAFCAAVMKMTVIACAGEARHFNNHSSMWNSQVRKIVVKLVTGRSIPTNMSAISRDHVYSGLLSKTFYPYDKLMIGMGAIAKTFSYGWVGGGYGGPKWQLIAEMFCSVLKAATQKDIAQFLFEFNRMLNLVHNNGWYLNKFLSQEVLNEATKYPLSQSKIDISLQTLEMIGENPSIKKIPYARHVFTSSLKDMNFVYEIEHIQENVDEMRARVSKLPPKILKAASLYFDKQKQLANFQEFDFHLKLSKKTSKKSSLLDALEKAQGTLQVKGPYETAMETKIKLGAYEGDSGVVGGVAKYADIYLQQLFGVLTNPEPVFTFNLPAEPVTNQDSSDWEEDHPEEIQNDQTKWLYWHGLNSNGKMIFAADAVDENWAYIVSEFFNTVGYPADNPGTLGFIAKMLLNYNSLVEDWDTKVCDNCGGYHGSNIDPKHLQGFLFEVVQKTAKSYKTLLKAISPSWQTPHEEQNESRKKALLAVWLTSHASVEKQIPSFGGTI